MKVIIPVISFCLSYEMLRQPPREGLYYGAPVHTFESVFGSQTLSQLFSLFLGMFAFSCKSCLSFSSNFIGFLNQALK